MRKFLFLITFLFFLPSAAQAQCNGIFDDGTVCGNISGVPNFPRPINAANAILNSLCTTTGAFPVRTASGWVCSTAQIISAMDYGVKCDNTTDDSVALLNALSAAIAPARVYLPAGNCILHDILIPAGVSLQGLGKHSTVIKPSADSQTILYQTFVSITLSNTSISNLKIDCGARVGNTAIKFVFARDVNLNNLDFAGCAAIIVLDRGLNYTLSDITNRGNLLQGGGQLKIWSSDDADYIHNVALSNYIADNIGNGFQYDPFLVRRAVGLTVVNYSVNDLGATTNGLVIQNDSQGNQFTNVNVVHGLSGIRIESGGGAAFSPTFTTCTNCNIDQMSVAGINHISGLYNAFIGGNITGPTVNTTAGVLLTGGNFISIQGMVVNGYTGVGGTAVSVGTGVNNTAIKNNKFDNNSICITQVGTATNTSVAENECTFLTSATSGTLTGTGNLWINNLGIGNLGDAGVVRATGTGPVVLGTAPSISALTVTSSFTATGLVTNADLVNSSTTIAIGANVGISTSGCASVALGGTCTLGATTDTWRATALGLGGAAPATGLRIYNALVNPTSNGQGAFGASATGGNIVAGQGSTNDLTLQNKSGGSVCVVATGTTTLNCTAVQIGGQGVRTPLSADTTYFIRTDGSDANTCLVNSAGGACKTFPFVMSLVAGTIDFAAKNVTIRFGNTGTFDQATYGSVNITPWVGGGTLTITGDPTNADNVVISSTTATGAINVSTGALPGNLFVQHLKLTTSGVGHGINVQVPASIIYSDIDFGAVASNYSHVFGGAGANINYAANYKITGAANCHLNVSTSGFIFGTGGVTVTLTGTPAFGAFACAGPAGIVQSVGTIFSGTATGLKFFSTLNGVINTNGGGLNYFPGTNNSCSPATLCTSTGGQYN